MPGAADAADLAPEGFAGRVLGALRSSRGRVFVLLRGAVPDARGDADRLQGPVVVVLDAAAVLNNRNNLNKLAQSLSFQPIFRAASEGPLITSVDRPHPAHSHTASTVVTPAPHVQPPE